MSGLADDDPRVFGPDGQLLGYSVSGEDGDMLLVGEDGAILGAVDANLQPFDPSEYGQYVTLADPGYDPYGGLDDRLAALEQRVAEPATTAYVPVYQPPPLSEQQISDDLQRQGHTLEAREGRPLLLREKRALAEALSEAAVAGERRPDLFAAAEQIAIEGRPLLDLDTGHRGRDHEARTELMASLLADREREAAQAEGRDDVTREVGPPRAEQYDVDSHSGRVTRALDRIEGRITAEDAAARSFDGSEVEAWEVERQWGGDDGL